MDLFQYKYLATQFENIEDEEEEDNSKSSTKAFYEEFVSLRRSYERIVADSIEQMAREEKLRNRIAKLKAQKN